MARLGLPTTGRGWPFLGEKRKLGIDPGVINWRPGSQIECDCMGHQTGLRSGDEGYPLPGQVFRMPAAKAPMALTPEVVARVERLEPDPGPRPEHVYLTDADYDAVVEELLERHSPSSLWVFAYGSLIWKPEFTSVEHRRATAYGWHRSFCLSQTRWRGTPEQPGLMMALDRGGCCRGVVYRLPKENHAEQLGRLVRREMSVKQGTNVPRWITVETNAGKLRAFAITASPLGANYAGKLPLEQVARTLARAAGHWGSGANYLYQTVVKLEEFGIRDSNLWRLQQLVADEILSMPKPRDEGALG